MKASRAMAGLILGLFTAFLCAQTPNKEYPNKNETTILWVVDDVALNDSVFGYTLEQMRSDSAAVLASHALSWVYPDDINCISVMDSAKAARNGFIDFNGVVQIATTFREPLLVVINGYLYKSKEKASAGEILGGYDWIQHILQNEFQGLKECGIKESRVLRQMNIGCHPQKYPLVIVTTELPYYRADILEGKYFGKRSKQSYELTLKADSTYIFLKKVIHKNAVVNEVGNYGTWEISESDVILNSSQDTTADIQGGTAPLKAVRLKINSAKTLTLPKGVWNNKKPLTLKRLHND